MISVLNAYKTGLRNAWCEKKMIVLLYGFNLFFAYLITIPVSMMLNNGLENRIAAEEMLDKFDFTYYLSLIRDFGSGFEVSRLILTFGILYIIVNTFFAGGILTTFHRLERFSLSEFFSGCLEFFSRFVRLFLFSLIFFLLALLIFMVLYAVSGAITENAETEFWPFGLFFLRFIIMIFLMTFVNMLFDYAKILVVVNDYRGMFQTIKRAIMFVIMNLRKTIVLYFLFFLTIGVLVLIYLGAEQLISVTSGFTVLIYFIWSQIFILVRMWLRLSFFAGQYTFYRFSNTAIPGMTKRILEQAVLENEAQLEGK